MKITVIGHICLDSIRRADSTEAEPQSYGGIFFSIVTLANLLRPNDSITPVFGIGKADYDKLIERLSQYPNVDTSGIFKINGPTNQVELVYSSKEDRVERSTNIVDPIPLKKIRPHLDADMVLINMISGLDITLATLDEIRMDVRDNHTPIYLDVHSLTLGIRDDFIRFLRPVDLWRRWMFMLHAVQMNNEEAAALTVERLDEDSLGKHTLALNTKALLITRGSQGCTAFIDNRKHIERTDIPAVKSKGAADPTGCGDIFAAAYCAHYMTNHDVLASARFANNVAGFKSQLAGSADLDSIAQFRIATAAVEERS